MENIELKFLQLKMLMNSTPAKFVFFLIAVFAINGCKVAAPPPLPVAQEMPDTYIGHTDTITDGRIQWQDFFTDPLLVNLIETALTNNFDLLTAIQRVEV